MCARVLGTHVPRRRDLGGAGQSSGQCEGNMSEMSEIAAPGKRSKAPSLTTMERWMSNGIAKATDGCRVEPDGHCPHGKPSWLIELGLI